MIIYNLLKSIFTSDKIDTIEKASKLIHSLLESMGTSHEEAKMEMEAKDTLGWMVTIGNVYIYIYLFHAEENKIFLKFVSPIAFMPEKNILPFYRTLLETNIYLNGYSIGVEKNLAIIQYVKNTAELEIEEAKKILEKTAKLSMEISERLIEDFKAVKFEIQ